MMLSAMSLMLKLAEARERALREDRDHDQRGADSRLLMKASIFAAVASTRSRDDAPSTERSSRSWFHSRPKQISTHTAV